MKKLLLILLCLPFIVFGQKRVDECYVTDTVILIDKMDYMEGYDLTFKSLTTVKEISYYIDYPNNISTKTDLQEFLILFDHIGWQESNISWDDMDIDQEYLIRYSLKRYKRKLADDITWGNEVVLGNYLIDVVELY